jgi:pyridoxine 5'-phosphate synthase PdxJ
LAGVSELNIGHSVISDALFVGLKVAVTELRVALEQAKEGLGSRG